MARFAFSFGRWAALALGLLSTAWARDAYVLLSGGGTPLTNQYSQYLQARAMAAHWQATYPPESVWVFFGAGNREGQPAVLGDVHQLVKEKGFLRDSWLPGVLKNNRPARKAEFLKALREEILPAVRDGGTLYLFIGDHGSLARKAPKESVVTMWQLAPAPGGSWRTDPQEELSVTELRSALDAGLGEGRVVFCMTQCHSGGFHFLGVQREMWPDEAWFTAPVAKWRQLTMLMPPPLAAGFTAVDEASLAAGCDPDPDPDKWAGYERYVPEALLGLTLLDGRRTGPGLPSFVAAHEQAVLVDQTIDKPRSTSEQYLEQWAKLIEKLAGEPALQPAVQTQIAAYQHAVDTGLAENPDPNFAARRAQFARFVARMTEQNPAEARLLASGTRAELAQAIRARGPRAERTSPAVLPPRERAQLWKDVLRPAWKSAVDGKKVKGLKGDALVFEKTLLAQEDKGRNLFAGPAWQNPLLNDIYWASGYAFPAKLKPGKAMAVSSWGAQRGAKILEWAQATRDPKLIAAAEKVFPARADTPEPERTLSTPIAAERALFYRRTLAAWNFLLALPHAPALAELQQLLELENTPLPKRGG